MTLMSIIHRKKDSESESSDWEDEMFLPVDEQDEYLQEMYGMAMNFQSYGEPALCSQKSDI